MSRNWVKLFNDEGVTLNTQFRIEPTKGKLVYEYNAFRNYRLLENLYSYKNKFYTASLLKKLNIDPDAEGVILEKEPGELTDLDTEELQFSLHNPITMIPLYSYDGSVNLIITDGLNEPKLINSRFSATGLNTYEVVDRSGNNDTNIYDQGELFDIDTSLYKKVIKIPKVTFKGNSSGGAMPVGNYHFYFKLMDADGNETDFVAESGLVSVFIGNGPFSATTGIMDENSFKIVNFKLTNLDVAYSYVSVYYSRYTSDVDRLSTTVYKHIDKKYLITANGNCTIDITGYEYAETISVLDINLYYNIIDAAKTATECLNMLFLGNVHKDTLPMKELQDLSLRFLPYVKNEPYKLLMDENYSIYSTDKGYYDEQNIYYNVGYWNEEIYRIGIVYIMKNGELSPVFNIRGSDAVTEYKGPNDVPFTNYPLYNNIGERVYIKYAEESNLILPEGGESDSISIAPKALLENVKGVIRLKTYKEHNIIHALDIRTSSEVTDELKKYVKGYFFVRQTRIPTILALGITTAIDSEAHTPVVTVRGEESFVKEIKDSLYKSHTVVDNINGPVHISEGFLSRYRFNVDIKKSAILKKGLKIAAGVFVVAVGVAGSLFTGGASLVAAGVGAGALFTAASITIAAGGAVAVDIIRRSALATIIQNAVRRSRLKKDLREDEGLKGDIEPINGRAFTYDKKTQKRVEIGNSRKLTHDFKERAIIKDISTATVEGIYCPDYELNQHYYNTIFTGNEHVIKTTINLPDTTNELKNLRLAYFNNRSFEPNYFWALSYKDSEIELQITAKVTGVPDGCPLVNLDKHKYRARAGWAEEAWRYECIGQDYKSESDKTPLNSDALHISNGESEETMDNKKINTEIIRGNFGPYVAFKDESDTFDPATNVNIFIPNYSENLMKEYFSIRMTDASPYKAISERFALEDIEDLNLNKQLQALVEGNHDIQQYAWTLHRGDCYICQFTHRINRNFEDPSALYNDEIINPDCWKEGYDPSNTEKYLDINLSDVNAVRLGMWVTFTVRSASNLNIRTLDESYADEVAMVGHPRGYFPYHYRDTSGPFKTPDSQTYNHGFVRNLSERYNIIQPDVPAIKNWYGTRVMYSDIHINDAFKNGYRYFQGTAYRDFTREYGEITKIISLGSSLFIVFEHGIGISSVTLKAIAANVQVGDDYLNTNNVLGELLVLSDTTGSLWLESIIQTPYGIYGVDTNTRLIWKYSSGSLTIISDFKVTEFLNTHITLKERELTPTIGVRNVKTVYNAFKNDVMFTFYDDTYSVLECVWNLCYNELLQQFTTFYSWVPSYMENINNMPFSFNRETSKMISKLGISHTENSFADGITLSLNIIGDWLSDNHHYIGAPTFTFKYADASGIKTGTFTLAEEDKLKDHYSLVGVLSIDNRPIATGKDIIFKVDYELEHDPYLNYKNFKIMQIGNLVYNSEDSVHEISYQSLTSDTIMGANRKTLDINHPYKKFVNTKIIKLPVYGLFVSNDAINSLKSELYYRNKAGHPSADFSVNRIGPSDLDLADSYFWEVKDLPIYKNREGKRLNLPRLGTNQGVNEAINANKLISLLHIKATISTAIFSTVTPSVLQAYYNYIKGSDSGIADGDWINAGYYESSVAVTPEWNTLFLSTDFWKHGQAGLIDIADDIYPCYWYGRQHPFEFEVIVNDPKNNAAHKIFTNLQLIANKAKPESFHYEVIGEVYDFAKDKKNAYYRQEAKKALWLWNGADICYNNNFLKVLPEQQLSSIDLPSTYTARLDTINDVEDYYVTINNGAGKDYRYLTGGEITYYPNRQEFRILNHVKAIALSDFRLDDPNQLIQSNLKYIENTWYANIQPLLITFKNEYYHTKDNLFDQSTWTSPNRPPITVLNSPIPTKAYDQIKELGGNVEFPPILHNLGYRVNDIDFTDWKDDISIQQMNYGEGLNLETVPLRDRFIKIRVRYSGEELAVIDYLKTLYTLSYA